MARTPVSAISRRRGSAPGGPPVRAGSARDAAGGALPHPAGTGPHGRRPTAETPIQNPEAPIFDLTTHFESFLLNLKHAFFLIDHFLERYPVKNLRYPCLCAAQEVAAVVCLKNLLSLTYFCFHVTPPIKPPFHPQRGSGSQTGKKTCGLGDVEIAFEFIVVRPPEVCQL